MKRKSAMLELAKWDAKTHTYEFKIWQDGVCVVSGSAGAYEPLWSEAIHYLAQYGEDSDNLKLSIGPKKRRKP